MALNPRMVGVGIGLSITVAGAALKMASPDLLDHLTRWESGGKRVLTVYADKLAGNLPTVCNGLTRHVTKTPIIVGETWPELKCVTEEAIAMSKVQRQLATCFKHPPTQSIFDMATSHGWNFGVSATCGSGAMTAWNRGEYERGCKRLANGDDGKVVWSFVRKGDKYVFVQGLANRRADEVSKCLAGIFDSVRSGVSVTHN